VAVLAWDLLECKLKLKDKHYGERKSGLVLIVESFFISAKVSYFGLQNKKTCSTIFAQLKPYFTSKKKEKKIP